MLISKYTESVESLMTEMEYDNGMIRGTNIKLESAPLNPEIKYLLLHIIFILKTKLKQLTFNKLDYLLYIVISQGQERRSWHIHFA